MIKQVKSLGKGLRWEWRFACHEYLGVDVVIQGECVEYENMRPRQEYASGKLLNGGRRGQRLEA